MIPESANPGLLGERASLLWVLGLSAVTLIGFGQALGRWQRYKNGATRLAALPYRNWSIAFAIALACLELGCFGPYWLRLAVGEVPSVHFGSVLVAALVLTVFLGVYGLEAPALVPSHGRSFSSLLDGLGRMAGAAHDQVLEALAILTLALLILPRLRGESFTWWDPAFILMLSACLGVLMRHIVRPRPRQITIRKFGTVRFSIPSSSVFHFIFDAAWLATGIALLQPPRSKFDWAFGVGLIAIPGLLVTARILGWRRRVE